MLRAARGITIDAISNTQKMLERQSNQTESLLGLLESQSEKELLQGLRTVLDQIAQGINVQKYFPNIATHVSSPNLQIRRLVYTYILQYAEQEPDLTLMTVNGIRKFMADSNAEARALSLKTLSSIKIPTLASIIAVSAKELLYDHAPIVRIACANAIGKCYELDPEMGPELLDMLLILASNCKDKYVHGCTVAVLVQYWPESLDQLHKLYFDICTSIDQYAEWAQVVVLRQLTYYTRTFMAPEDKDLMLLFESCRKMVLSLNPAVVLQVASTVHHLGDSSLFASMNIAKSLTKFELSSIELTVVKALASDHRLSFADQYTSFIPLPTEPSTTLVLKLEILALLVNAKSAAFVFNEMQFVAAITSCESTLRQVMNVVASCAIAKPKLQTKVRHWLLSCLHSESEHVVAESMTVLRFLASDKQARKMLLWKLHEFIRSYDTKYEAKEYFIFMMGEHIEEEPELACELCRQLLNVYKNQPSGVRYQTMQLMAKLFSIYDESQPNNIDSRIPQMFNYSLELGRYDPEIDVRDRARLFAALLNPDSADLARLMLKPSGTDKESKPQQVQHIINSTEQVLGHNLMGYKSLPDWGRQSPLLRKQVKDQPKIVENPLYKTTGSIHTPARTVPGSKLQSLEEFLGSGSESESNESDEYETEEEEESEEEAETEAEDDSDQNQIDAPLT